MSCSGPAGHGLPDFQYQQGVPNVQPQMSLMTNYLDVCKPAACNPEETDRLAHSKRNSDRKGVGRHEPQAVGRGGNQGKRAGLHRQSRGRASGREAGPGGLEGEPNLACSLPAPQPPEARGLPGGPDRALGGQNRGALAPAALPPTWAFWVRACKGHTETLGARAQGPGSPSCSALGRLPRGGIGMAVLDPEEQPTEQPPAPSPPHQHQGSLFSSPPQAPLRPAPPCSPEGRGRSTLRHALHGPIAQVQSGLRALFLPLQRPTHPVEQRWGGTLGHPASSHRLRGGSRGEHRSHLGGEETQGRQEFSEQKRAWAKSPKHT